MGFLYHFTLRIKRFFRKRKVAALFLRRAVHVVRDGERSTSVPHTTSMHYITKRVIARERWTLSPRSTMSILPQSSDARPLQFIARIVKRCLQHDFVARVIATADTWFRTCRTSSFCAVAWQLARFQLTRRIARSLGDS